MAKNKKPSTPAEKTEAGDTQNPGFVKETEAYKDSNTLDDNQVNLDGLIAEIKNEERAAIIDSITDEELADLMRERGLLPIEPENPARPDDFFTVESVNAAIQKLNFTERSQLTDGYHTFDQQYETRHELYIALCRVLAHNAVTEGRISPVWRSKKHSDGGGFEGYFLLGINRKAGEQITYHLPDSRWEETDFAVTRERAPEFDGHTSTDVLQRLKTIS